MKKVRVSVILESVTGRNTKFLDNLTGQIMTRSEFVRKIDSGKYPDYYVRVVNKVRTPVSKPDNATDNNLN